ncbi:hypothetical protein D3C72_1179700 [compost metagenome]
MSGDSRWTTIRMSGDVFWVTTPCRCTSAGRRGNARDTRFCTWTCAMSGFVPSAKVTVRIIRPSVADCEDMYIMPSTPVIACSKGAATVSAITFGLAPG